MGRIGGDECAKHLQEVLDARFVKGDVGEDGDGVLETVVERMEILGVQTGKETVEIVVKRRNGDKTDRNGGKTDRSSGETDRNSC